MNQAPRLQNPETDELVPRHRTTLGRLVGVFVFAYVLLVAPPAIIPATVALACEALGFVLLVAAAFGRLWCLVYIAGSKNRVLQTEGPYSVVRNPLYFFSFLGAIGFGLAVRNPFLAVFMGGAFTLLHALTVRSEEVQLGKLFGDVFTRYCATVPRWFPKWSLYRESAQLTVDPRRIRHGMLDAMWFLWAFLLWELLDSLRALGIVSTLA